MQNILCFGEALIDFINTEQVDSDGLIIPEFGQYPGGAPANAAVAIAKLGGRSAFVGQVGDDQFGAFLKNAMSHYGVDTRHLKFHPSAKTALAFVHLDKGERSFSFYRDNTADLLYQVDAGKTTLFEEAAVLHFCSNTLTHEKIASQTQILLERARERQVLVSMDVNLRHNLWPQGAADKAVIREFVAEADLLKFSREEIEYLADDVAGYVQALTAHRCKLLIITQDGGAVEYYTPDHRGRVQAPKVEVLDTTAAGDSFIGGLLFELGRTKDIQAKLTCPEELELLVQFATRCGSFTVTRYGAFPAMPTLADVME